MISFQFEINHTPLYLFIKINSISFKILTMGYGSGASVRVQNSAWFKGRIADFICYALCDVQLMFYKKLYELGRLIAVSHSAEIRQTRQFW
jgi:hypothetical protein